MRDINIMRNKNDILDADATSILNAYSQGKADPVKVVETYIAHQKALNAKLNIVAEERYAAAMDEAKKYKAEIKAKGVKKRLHGVPISMKEAFNVKGMHTTGGISARKDYIAAENAAVVDLLVKEGAIILDKSNTPALCFCQETDNYLTGRSSNPWNPDYTTGGSSGGEAAVIAGGGAAAGFGSDIGGSIRIPSHFNGVIGFKPGYGAFPDEGHLPDKATDMQKIMLGYGPVTKSVRDAALLYSIVNKQFSVPRNYSLDKKIKLYVFNSFDNVKCDDDTIAIHSKAADSFRNAGVEVINFMPDEMKSIARAWQIIMSEDGGQLIKDIAYPESKRGYLADYIKQMAGIKTGNHPFLVRGLVSTSIINPGKATLKKIEDFQKKGRETILEKLGNNGLFLIPVYPTPALKHGMVYKQVFGFSMSYKKVMPFIAMANVFGFPAISVPCGFSHDKLPIGMQLVGHNDNLGTLFKAAAFLEEALGGYQRCTYYD